MLSDRTWKLKYTPDDGNLVKLFYIPALEDAERYDRLTGYFNARALTGYFNARALTLAARGIEGLVRNGGHMRLVVGCTLEPAEIESIAQGENLRGLVEQHLVSVPLAPPNSDSSDALELLAWMIARGHLEVKVAVPCDAKKKPVPMDGIFHEKAGIVEDRTDGKIAWNGSLNETAAGWQHNWESINVYTSWGTEPQRVSEEEANFARIWADQALRVIVLDVPDAVKRDLMRFMPKTDKPARLKEPEETPEKLPPNKAADGENKPENQSALLTTDLRSRVWLFIQHAPSLPDGGARVGEVTSAITPWPHQVRAFERLYADWPPSFLSLTKSASAKPSRQDCSCVRLGWPGASSGS